MSHLQEILTSELKNLPRLPKHKRVALKHIMTCKTQECGTIRRQCDECYHSTYQYKSCGSRFCNQCGHLRKSIWIDDRLHESLNTDYFFYTYTIPQRLHTIFLLNETLCYKLLFKSSADALKAAMGGQYQLGLITGFMSVLHTCNQQLGYHPHIHMLIPGGGISEDHTEWVPSKKKFLVPEKILKFLFRTKLCCELKKAFAKGELEIPTDLKGLQGEDVFFTYIYGKETTWNIRMDYLGDNPEHIINYLGRYVNKTAISDERIINVEKDIVTISTKNRTTKDIEKIHLSKKEFVRRFLLHLLPKGIARIRYFGFLSCRFKSKMLSLLDRLLSPRSEHLSKKSLIGSLKLIFLKLIIKEGQPCPHCHRGHLKIADVQDGIVGSIKAHLFGPPNGLT
jgi:hypothetical protein